MKEDANSKKPVNSSMAIMFFTKANGLFLTTIGYCIGTYFIKNSSKLKAGEQISEFFFPNLRPQLEMIDVEYLTPPP